MKRGTPPSRKWQNDDEDYIYELKLDGIRCVAYIERKSVTLQNKRFKELIPIYPELSDICKCVKKKVILDGELVILTDRTSDFYALQKRSLKQGQGFNSRLLR